MSITVNGSNGLTFNDGSSQTTASTSGLVNRIINGDMRIDQRNAGASVTPTNDGTYTLDRWQFSLSAASKFSTQQSSTAPTGFINSNLITSLSAYSVPAGGYFMFNQPIEGLNVSDLAWGTASASAATLSFWVRSSLTGTFGGAIQNSAQNRAYPFSYTISAANTWEQKTITIAGDTTGTWLTTNGVGMFVRLGLGVGSNFSTTANAWTAGQYFSCTGATSVVGTNGATFYITGVDLRKGSTGATAQTYDWRPYSTELALCQRYFLQTGSASAYQPIFGAFGTCITTTLATLYFPLPASMRTSPTLAYTGTPRLDNGQAGFNISAMTGAAIATNLSTGVLNITSSGLTLYQPVKIDTNAGGSIVTLSAEL